MPERYWDNPNVVVDELAIAEVLLRLERPLDPESLLDESAFEADEFLPYWAELWPSATALANRLATMSIAGLSVMELGAGLGLPSLVAARRGATVLAVDWAADAIALLRTNARRNGVDRRLTAQLADWRDPSALPSGPFDLVLASDVLYEARNVEPLVAAITSTLGPNGEALVADPGRRHLDAFLDRADADLSVTVNRGDWARGARLVELRSGSS